MAQYRAGRVTVVTDSDVVAGIDTVWAGNVATGDIFLVRGEEIPYRVSAVIDNTTLRINGRYAGPTETNTTYSITRDFTPNLDLPVIHNGDVDAVPLFAEALIIIDGKWGTGGGGGGVGGAMALGDLSNVTVAGAASGDQFTMLPNGTFGFIRPTPFTIAFDHAAGDGARIFKSYTNGTVTARRIKAAGGTVTENPDDITINIPAPGEVNTLESAGSAQSQSLTAAKSGAILRTRGLRAGPNVTLTPEGNDIVIGATGGGGTAISHTMASTGNGVSLVATPSGTEFRIKAIQFDGHFTATNDAGGGIAVSLNKLPISDISTVLWESITPGQVLTRNSAGNVVGTAMPTSGLVSVQQDTSPRLGGPLDTTGQRLIGVPISFSGTIERPRGKSYIICLSAPAALRLDSVTTSTVTGSLSFRVDIGSPPEPETQVASLLQGTASTVRQTISASAQMLADPSQTIVLTASAVSADIQDFTFTIAGATV